MLELRSRNIHLPSKENISVTSLTLLLYWVSRMERPDRNTQPSTSLCLLPRRKPVLVLKTVLATLCRISRKISRSSLLGAL